MSIIHEEKDHVCTGKDCIFCRLLAIGAPMKKAGKTFLKEQVLSKVHELDQYDLLGKYKENNQQVDQIELLEKVAFYDPVTGLFNMHTFLRELDEEVARVRRYHRPLSICILSVDQLDEVKSNQGPLGCETVLKYIAAALQSMLREVDIPARYRGEQFAIILPETNLSGAQIVAERIKQELSSSQIKLSWQSINVFVSFGIAAFPRHGQERDELIQNALAALVKAIAEGGNKVCSI